MGERAMGASPEVRWGLAQAHAEEIQKAAEAVEAAANSVQRDETLRNLRVLLVNAAGVMEAFPELRRASTSVIHAADEVRRAAPIVSPD
jgi:hypothetical protein